MLHRQCLLCGRPPCEASLDGGFASNDNLTQAKALGVEDVCFAKRRGLAVLDMVKSSWVYRKLKRFCGGIESIISLLKRAFGLDRCTRKGDSRCGCVRCGHVWWQTGQRADVLVSRRPRAHLKTYLDSVAARTVHRLVLSSIIVGLQVAAPPLLGQDAGPATPPVHAWLTFGLGAGNAGSWRGAAAASFDVQARRHLFSFRATVLTIPFEDNWDVGLLYGQSVRGSRRMAGASAGLALTGGSEACLYRSGVSCSNVPRVGVPLAARVGWNSSEYFGFGIYAFADINTVQSFVAAALAIQIGRVR